MSTDKRAGCSEPILKWPGGKRWLTVDVCPIVQEELAGTYYEPFLGGAAMYLSLDADDAVLSDTNCQLIDFYKTCVQFPERVVDRARQFLNDENTYYRVRSSNPTSDIGKAARFFYLNKTCWGGIYRLNKHGDFNVPFGNSGRKICNKHMFVGASAKLGRAELKCCDFADALSLSVSGDVVFADPPYTSRGQFNGFVRYNEKLFSWADQVRLCESARSARRRGVFVAVCGALHRDILSLYENWWVLTITRCSSIARKRESRKLVSECVLFSRKPKIKFSKIQKVTQTFIQSIPFYEN